MIAGMSYRIALARLLFALASASGVIGIILGFASNRAWKLGPVGWLILGTFGMVAAVAVLADEFIARRSPPASK